LKKFIDIIKKKWLIDTTKTIIMVTILLILFILLNLGIQNLNLSFIDVTKNKLFSLSESSKDNIKSVTEEIKIYFFGIEENSSIIDLAKQYSNENNKISIEVINISERPDMTNKYGLTENNSALIVQGSEKYKILAPSEFTTYDYSTNSTIDITEQKLTNAILDVSTTKRTNVYFLTGHEEIQNNQLLQVYLTNEIYDIENLDLLINPFPDNCDCLIIASPSKDFSEYELDIIIDYINNGGKILWLNDIPTNNLPNVQKILYLYGATLSSGIVLEEDNNRIIAEYPNYIIPDISYHKITDHIMTDGALMFFNSTKIDIVDDETLNNLNVDATPFIQSSTTSFFRQVFSHSSNAKTSEEESGPFNLGVEFNKTINESISSKLILFSNNKFSTDTMTIEEQSIYPISIYSNKDLVLNSVSYLTDKEDSITIRKDTGAITYISTQSQDNIIKCIIFGIPILIIISGIVVGQIRKRK